MKKLCLSLVLGIVAFGVGAARAQAQDAAAAPQSPMSKPPVTYGYDLRPQVLPVARLALHFAHTKLVKNASPFDIRFSPLICSE